MNHVPYITIMQHHTLKCLPLILEPKLKNINNPH